MKKIIAFLCFTFIFSALFSQQKDQLHITCKPLKTIVSGSKINLPVAVIYQAAEEKTGTLTLELLNTADNTSVDGWFLNIFPFQYFTTIKKEKFSTTFPFTIPSNFTGKFRVVLKANCNNSTDSLSYIVTVHSK